MRLFRNASFNIPTNCLLLAILLYIYIGILFFLIGWCAWYVSLICTAILLYVVFRMFLDYRVDEVIKIRFSTITGIVIMGIVLYTIGWGRFTNQVGDWQKHNAIINDLVCYDWPVIYENRNGEKSMLTYYLAQYLVPCAIGKLFSSYRIAEITNALWAYWGLILVYLNLLRFIKGKTVLHDIIALFLLLFFSCPTEIGKVILSWFIETSPTDEAWFYYNDDIKLQYSNNLLLLEWVYIQVIVNWMILTLFIEKYRKVEYYAPLLLPALLYGSFSFLGLIPYAIVWVVYQLIINKKKTIIIRNILSSYNILTIFSLGTVIIIYLLGNVTGEKPAEISFGLTPYSGKWLIYIVFVCTMVLPYILLLFKENRNNWLCYTTLASLLVCPLFTMGLYNDFTMRSSIPALFVLMTMTATMMINYRKHIVRSIIMILLILYSVRIFLIQTLVILKEDVLSELAEDHSFGSLGQFTNREDLEIEAPLKYNYFTYNLENSLFYKYLSRK